MNDFRLVYPMFAMVLLTAIVLANLFRSRVRAVRANKVSIKYFRTYQGEIEPEETAKPARHFANLFEAPVLFYAACITAMLTEDTGMAALAPAWTYVAARALHTYIHMGANRVRHRLRAYFASWLVLMALWIQIVVHVAMHG